MPHPVYDLLLSWLTPNGVIAVGVLYGIWRMIMITREARIARQANIAATKEAVTAAKATQAAIEKQGANLAELTVNTNSIKDALVKATAKASDLEGEKRGIAMGTEQAAAAAAAAAAAKP